VPTLTCANSDHSKLLIYYLTGEQAGNLSICRKVTTGSEFLFLLFLKNLCQDGPKEIKTQAIIKLLDSIPLFDLAWNSLPEISQICLAERYGFDRGKVNSWGRYFKASLNACSIL
jgi:hypothetical protein